MAGAGFVWTTDELLALVGPDRAPADSAFEYSSTNYVLLGLIIEQVTDRPVAEVLRKGALGGAGHERLIHQPDERPTEPMAVPDGAPAHTLKNGGGYLPSLAGATSAGPAGAMASDSATLARWWGRLCGGQIVSGGSFSTMTNVRQSGDYALGIADMSPAHGPSAVGNGGLHVGFTSYAVCLPEQGAVVGSAGKRRGIRCHLGRRGAGTGQLPSATCFPRLVASFLLVLDPYARQPRRHQNKTALGRRGVAR